jgi:hypothetical protein
MAGTNKIFKDLQNYSVSPPGNVYAKLWRKIRGMSLGKETLLDTESLPDTHVTAESAGTGEDKILSSLQSYVHPEHTAPPFDFKKISEALANNGEKPAVPQKSKLIVWGYRAAAAAAITGIAFFIYTQSAKPDQEQTAINTSQQGRLSDTNKIEPVIPATAKATYPAQIANKTENTPVKRHQYHQTTGKAFITNNVNANILDNDFLYTLTSFNYGQAEDFLADIKNDPKISLDKYSYVNVSDKMAVFLKQLYAVNGKKKPTLKARRLKKKLNKWKRNDEDNFDNKIRKNPLDILDLSEFIFK